MKGNFDPYHERRKRRLGKVRQVASGHIARSSGPGIQPPVDLTPKC